MKLTYRVEPESMGLTVKHILKVKLGLSERLIKKLKYSGNITVNSLHARVIDQVYPGDEVIADLNFMEENIGIIPQEIPLDIIFEDAWLIAVDKQPGIVVHPTSSHPDGTIANALMLHLNNIGEKTLIRPVSRLDRDTSGIILFAKNQFIQEELIKQMADKTFEKEYLGIVHGQMPENSGTIDLPIERKPGSIMLREVSSTGAQAVTHYDVLEDFRAASFLRFKLETGRTHQIRVHCQALGHSLLGDSLYPPTVHDKCILCGSINRQALHSCKVTFIHPYEKVKVELQSKLPSDMLSLLEILRKMPF